MGVLNIQGRIRRKSRGDYDFDVIGWEDFTEDPEIETISRNEEEDERSRLAADHQPRSRQRKSPEKKIKPGSYEQFTAKKKGVRGKRRYDNMCYLLSLVDDIDVNEIDDDDHPMTVFAELFMDSEKMKMWNEFINLPEDRQQSYLENRAERRRDIKFESTKEIEKKTQCRQAFDGIDQKIKDYLRSKCLAKDALREFEEDILSTIEDFPSSVLILKVPSSYSRILIHGICQYAKLRALTHKNGSECLMEIECRKNKCQFPPKSLTEYLSR